MLLVCAIFPDLPRLEEYIYSEAAAAAAKLLQSCLTLCDPIDGSPPVSSVPRILQARILEWVAISFSNTCTHAKSLQSCPILCAPWTAAHQAPLSVGFSRQEYWSGLPFPSPLIRGGRAKCTKVISYHDAIVDAFREDDAKVIKLVQT